MHRYIDFTQQAVHRPGNRCFFDFFRSAKIKKLVGVSPKPLEHFFQKWAATFFKSLFLTVLRISIFCKNDHYHFFKNWFSGRTVFSFLWFPMALPFQKNIFSRSMIFHIYSFLTHCTFLKTFLFDLKNTSFRCLRTEESILKKFIGDHKTVIRTAQL